MNALICLEESQTIQRAFEEWGHNSYSCDLKPARLNPSRHFQGDVFEVLDRGRGRDWDLIIIHPVCRYLSVSGQHWCGRPGHEDRASHRDAAIHFFLKCAEYAKRYAERSAIENPRGIMKRFYRAQDQTVQPYQFGDDASKTTDLWEENLPLLVADPGEYVEPRWVDGKPRWANQTDSGQNRLGPTKDPEDRRAARAVSYQGIARAMAAQWGGL